MCFYLCFCDGGTRGALLASDLLCQNLTNGSFLPTTDDLMINILKIVRHLDMW